MKETVTKGLVSLFLAGMGVYFRELLGPLIILIAVMAADYATGLAEAWISKTLSSHIGIVGIVKKTAYLAAVGVAIVVDFIIQTAAGKAGLDLGSVYACGLLVTVWLILNECISILENIAQIGVPLPGFLKNLVEKLKKTAEDKGGDIAA